MKKLNLNVSSDSIIGIDDSTKKAVTISDTLLNSMDYNEKAQHRSNISTYTGWKNDDF